MLAGQLFKGVYFDGYTAGRHPVTVALNADHNALVITGEHQGDQAIWPLEDIRLVTKNSQSGELILTVLADTDDEKPRDPARLTLDDDIIIDWILENCTNLKHKDVSRALGEKILKRLVLAVAAVLVVFFFILPRMADTLATLIPIEREIAFGQSVVAQMERFLGGGTLGALHCDGDEGREALETLMDRLTADQPLEYDIVVTVFDHPMVNAFAAPGGQVVLLRGLLEEASGPDAVAGVVAHEIGHVETRDATRLSLRAAGSAGLLSMVLGDFAGAAVVVVIAEQLLSSAYTREAEAAADAFALAMLNTANISSEGFAEFFEFVQMIDSPIDLPEYLASHPAAESREAQARQNAEGQYSTWPSLSEGEWEALQSICD